jgi:hypothetical protein
MTVVVFLVVLLTGCATAYDGARGLPVTTKAVLPEGTSPGGSVASSVPTLAPTVTAGATSVPTLSPSGVMVTTKGNLYIRRGPDLAFDPISVLPRGQTAFPNGRDVLSHWLRIQLPGNPSKFGWISIMSEFTLVVGDVSALPEFMPVEWPRLAFVRNCTHHEMMVEPLGLVIPSILSFPDNDVRVNPGSYSVQDLDVDGYPEVLSMEIREGSAIDIVVDGNGEKKKCPTP